MDKSSELQGKQTIVDDNLREVKAHGTEGFPIGIYLDDFSDFENGYICWHWHEEVQATMILEGDFLYQLDGKEMKMSPGDIIFINSGLLHQIRPCVREQGKLYSFIWRAELIGGKHTDIYKECIAPVLNRRINSVFWSNKDKNHEKIADCLRKAVLFYEKKEGPYQLQVQQQIASFWLELYERVEHECMDEIEENSGNDRDSKRVKAALQYIYEHYQESVKLDEIAQAAYVSRSELCRSFQRIVQTSPMEFLMQFRIRQATVLLKKQDLRIADVAEMVGFCSPSHFGSNFMKYMGCTPKEYRVK